MGQNFLAELKRRKVLRVVGAYAVVAWAALQVADKLFPALLLPQWTITFVAVLLLIGLPITVIITWAFEITPDGVRRTSLEPDSNVAPARGAWRSGWIESALLLAIVAAVAVSIAQLNRPDAVSNEGPAVGTPAAGAPAAGEGAAGESAAGALGAGTQGATTPIDVPVANSIAVLPFTSFSDDAESNYFADGLTEELINDLAHIAALKVSGRTSSFYFKNRNEDLREIGRQLGVSHVLEGSVRRAGDKLRITVQLISTADGFHLWSQTYDRRLDDIFAIQDDVAANVATTLEVKLDVGPRKIPDALQAGEDYRLYLIAMALLRERELEPLTQARALFAGLKERQPDNVDALAGYTQATMLLAGTYMTLDFEPAAKDAIDTVERALAIDPDSVSANVAAGAAYTVLLHRTDEHRYRELAERHLAHAVELAPNDPDTLAAYGTLLNQLGRYDTALDVLRPAVARDPLSRLAQAQLITALVGLGRLAEARDKLLMLMEVYPDYVFAQLELGELLLMQGRIDAAMPYLRRAHESRTSPRATFALAHAYVNLGLEEELQRTLAELDYSPLSKPFGEIIQINVRGDDAAGFRLARQQLQETGDPIWRAMLINAALRLGDLETARRELTELEPNLLTSLDATRVPAEPALFAGQLLRLEGRGDDATRLLDGLLTSHAPPAHGYDPVAKKLLRAKALAISGRNEAALDELRAAQLQGNRALWDFDYFQRIDQTPEFAALRDDARFRAMVAEMEAANRAMRDRVQLDP